MQGSGPKEVRLSRGPTAKQIASDEAHLVARQQRFRLAADHVTVALACCEAVEAVALIGSAAHPLWREVPRFANYRRLRLPIAHECKDLDLAVWVSRLDTLDELRRARARAAGEIFTLTAGGVAVHEVDIFLLDPGTDRYLGRLCYFGNCPAEKRDCRAEGCGRERFLKQHDGFVFWPETIAGEPLLRLYDRAAGGIVARAADLPPAIQDGERIRCVQPPKTAAGSA
jgi:hypothetical protein